MHMHAASPFQTKIDIRPSGKAVRSQVGYYRKTDRTVLVRRNFGCIDSLLFYRQS
jgi:hypothetical protein